MSKFYGLVVFLYVMLAFGCAPLRDGGQITSYNKIASLVYDFPIPSEAQIQVSSVAESKLHEGTHTIALSEKSQAVNLDFYLRYAASYGWELKSRKTDSIVILKFVKNTRLVTVEISYRGVGIENKSQITIVHAQKVSIFKNLPNSDAPKPT
jgi:hypothetical protein